MKTEREQLEENTKVQKAVETAEGVKAYIEYLIDECNEAFRWEMRGDVLFFSVMGLNLLTLFFCMSYFETREPVALQMDLFSLLIWISLLRSYWLMGERKRAVAEIEGVLNILELLGHAKFENGSGSIKRLKHKSMFQRFKELFERVESKDGKEAYA
jgi:hypothetical protein